MSVAASLATASTCCSSSFKPARSCKRMQRHQRFTVAARASQEAGPRKAVMSGLAALASVPFLFSGPAVAFVGNTASDFSEKVDRYTPSPSDVKDVVSSKTEEATPDVPLPGLKQKGKEANAIGKAPAQSGPGAADQVKDAADKAGDKGSSVLENAKPKRGLFERINDEALTKNSPAVQQKS